jgi:hypothetical protein
LDSAGPVVDEAIVDFAEATAQPGSASVAVFLADWGEAYPALRAI